MLGLNNIFLTLTLFTAKVSNRIQLHFVQSDVLYYENKTEVALYCIKFAQFHCWIDSVQLAKKICIKKYAQVVYKLAVKPETKPKENKVEVKRINIFYDIETLTRTRDKHRVSGKIV